MPTFSQSLEQSLHRALAIANERHHQYATLEHLLLSLIDDSDAAAVMRACSVDLDKLRTSLVNYLETEFENLVTDGADDAKPTAGFQRVIQRAVIHVQSSGREEVTGANVLIAIFAERESHAAYFLQEQDMTRYDAVNYISHAITKLPSTDREKEWGNRASQEERILASSPIAALNAMRLPAIAIDQHGFVAAANAAADAVFDQNINIKDRRLFGRNPDARMHLKDTIDQLKDH